MTKDTQPKPSAGALRAAREILDTDHQLAAQIIDRETGVGELLEATKALRIAAIDTGLTQEQEDDNQDVQLVDAVLAVEQAIAKCEGKGSE